MFYGKIINDGAHMKKEAIDIKNNDIPEERLKKYYKEFKVSTLMDDMKFNYH